MVNTESKTNLTPRKGRPKKAKEAKTLYSFVSEVWTPWIQENLSCWKSTRRIAEAYIVPVLGYKNIDKIDSSMISDWQTDLEIKGLAQTTRVRILYVLRSIFKLAVKLNWICNSPCPKAEREKPERKPDRILPLDKTRQIYSELMLCSRKEAAAILLMIYANVAKNVILKAKREDVFLDDGLLLHTKANVKRSRILLNNDAVDIIRNLPSDSHWLFPSEDKTKPLCDIFYFWNSLRKKAGVPDLLLCELRQSYNYWRFRLGNADLREKVTLNLEKSNDLVPSSVLL